MRCAKISIVLAAGVTALTPTDNRRRLLTFDLDDTLWPTAPVVVLANDALSARMASFTGGDPLDSKALQGRIKQCRDEASMDLSYSDLRKRAIASVLGDDDDDPGRTENLFQVWLEARHAAAEDLLYPGAVPVLEAIKDRWTDVIIGAVTNGRGDPLAMPSLRPYFDFCVTAEDPRIFPHRKPSPHIFQAALDVAGPRRSWVHVGDDLLNDVDAAKNAGARTVWFDDPAHQKDDAFTTKSSDERTQRRQRADAVLHGDRIDQRITSLADLPPALDALFE